MMGVTFSFTCPPNKHLIRHEAIIQTEWWIFIFEKQTNNNDYMLDRKYLSCPCFDWSYHIEISTGYPKKKRISELPFRDAGYNSSWSSTAKWSCTVVPGFSKRQFRKSVFWENLYFQAIHVKVLTLNLLQANRPTLCIRCKFDIRVVQRWKTIGKGNDQGGKERSQLYRRGWRLGQSQYQLCSCFKQMLGNVQLICARRGATKN